MKSISGKRISVLFAVLLPLALVAFTIIFWDEVYFGWTLPEKAKETSKEYFEGTKTPPEPYHAWSFRLSSGDEWKVVGVDTNGLRSFKSWLILVAQNQEKETYTLKESFDYTRMRSLYQSFSAHTHKDTEERIQRFESAYADDTNKSYIQIMKSQNSAELRGALELTGFKKEGI